MIASLVLDSIRSALLHLERSDDNDHDFSDLERSDDNDHDCSDLERSDDNDHDFSDLEMSDDNDHDCSDLERSDDNDHDCSDLERPDDINHDFSYLERPDDNDHDFSDLERWDDNDHDFSDLERWEDIDHDFSIILKRQLKNLELFVLCARKLGDDAQLRFADGKVSTLESLLQRIHDALPVIPCEWVTDVLKYKHAVANLKNEIGHWYNNLSVSLPQPTFDEVMDLIDSVLENLRVILFSHQLVLLPPIEAMIEKITFLRNFILFATLRSVEPRQLLDNLLVHIQAVAVDAAHTSYIYFLLEDDVRPNIPVLLQMIKMVDPQVDEICTQVLMSSKLSTQLHSSIPDEDHDPSVTMKDFIDFLLWNLSERLHMDTPIVIYTNSELQLVYEGLRLLRSMLEKQPNKFDKKIGELTRVAICDAGVIIFSHYTKDMEIFVPASDLLQIVKGKDFSIPDLRLRISHIRQRVQGKDLSIPNLLRRIHGARDQVFYNNARNIKLLASFVIDSIRDALFHLERWDYCFEFLTTIAMMGLKNLELFVLCARKWSNDEQLRFDDGRVSTLGFLLQRIDDALPATPYNQDSDTIFENFISSNFHKEIGHWYNTLSVSLPKPTFDEVMEIIDSVLENLHVILRWLHGSPFQPIEAMIEKITFLRNFILFVTLRNVEPQQLLDNLLVHIQAVAVDAAHTSYIYIFQYKYDVYDFLENKDDVELNIPVLLHMIRMVDPQVDEICTQVLISSKLSTQLHSPIPDKDHDPSVTMKDFIDSLLWTLWERMHMDTPIVIYTNSELQLVYEGLRLLRSMLQEQPNKFDKKIGELTRVAICDAGVIIFSLYKKDMEIFVPTLLQIVKGKDLSIPDLLPRISRIRQRVQGKDLSIPDLLRRIHGARDQVGGNDLPRTNELGFIDFFLENLLGMTSSKACHGLHSQFQMIHRELSSLRDSLGEIEEVRNEQKDLEDLWNAGVKLAYNVEFLIDKLVFGDFQVSSSTSFDSIAEDILEEVKSVNSNIHLASDIKVKKVSMTPNPVSSQNRAPAADEIVGFDDDITSIIDRLTRGSKQLKMVAIVGMPGIGKTTLATKVFNHPSVTFHFHVRLQCCVSQLFHAKKLLLELLKLGDPNTNIGMSEHDLTEKLWRDLKGKRYLISLDDVWDIEAWNSLRASFPDDNCKSRILMTSRHRAAVPEAIIDQEPLSVRLLTADQSWELLGKRLPPTIDWSPALEELGKQIAANCKGLPLTVVVVAGLLANVEPQSWKIFLESISSFSGANHCKEILELSYKHLPGHLKQCFLYFGLFPEDREVYVRKLIRLWIAEGFVRKTESKRLEDETRDYLMDLVGRSLVTVSKERSRGGVKACRIHDLLHDFCRTKAKEENFFQVLNGYNELLSFEEPDYMRRLCVHSETNHFKNLRLFRPCLHSLLFFPHNKQGGNANDMSFIIPSRLRVLDIGQYPLTFWSGILSEIGVVLQLKYLSVGGHISHVPSSIGSLTNLETFILYSYFGREVSLPDTFWNLQKLRHLDILGGFRLAFENLEKFPDLCELQSCCRAVIRSGESIERLVRKFPNIRKLGCELDSNQIENLKLDSASQLESLRLGMNSSPGPQRLEFDFPGNLRKLRLGYVLLRQSDISRIGKLPNLEAIKFDKVNFEDDTWDMLEGEFSTLKFLQLEYSDIVRWTAASDDQLRLEKLVLKGCISLREIGCCFESIGTLEMVQVDDCSDYVKRFFKGIEDEQRELGNSSLKIRISD